MGTPINKKRFREEAAAPPSEPVASTRLSCLLTLDETSKKVDEIYDNISKASFITLDSIFTSLDQIKSRIEEAHAARPTDAVLVQDLLEQLLKRFETELNQAEDFNEIKKISSQISGNLEKLSSFDKDNDGSRLVKHLIEKIDADFLLIVQKLKDLSNEINAPVLDRFLALKLETARTKYLQLRGAFEEKGLITASMIVHIPKFFLHLDIYNYQRALLPIVHHLIQDKYKDSSNVSVAQMATRFCRQPTPVERETIDRAYNDLPAEIKETLEEYANNPKYRPSEIPKGSGEYYKVKAKVLRDLIDADPNFFPAPVDPRSFPHTQMGRASRELTEEEDSKVDEYDTVYRPPSAHFDSSSALPVLPGVPQFSRGVLFGLGNCEAGASQQAPRSPDPVEQLSQYITGARLERQCKPAPDALFDRHIANLSPEDRALFTQYREMFVADARSPSAITPEAKALFDEYIRAAVNRQISAYIAQGRLSPTTSSIDIYWYIDIVQESVDQILATSSVANTILLPSPNVFRAIPLIPLRIASIPLRRDHPRDFRHERFQLPLPGSFSQELAQLSPRSAADEDGFSPPMPVPCTQPSIPRMASPTDADMALPLFGQEEVRDTNAILMDIFSCLKNDLFRISEADRSSPVALREFVDQLELPAPILANFYAHVRDVAIAQGLNPVAASQTWAAENAFSSYEYVKQGLFHTVSGMLTESQRNVFETWFKVSSMPAPRTPDAIRAIVESRTYSEAQITRFYEGLKAYERRVHPITNLVDLPDWAQSNAYTDYTRTCVALSQVFLHELSI